MTASNRATVCLGCAAVLAGGLWTANGASVRWHIIANGSPPVAFALNPANPTTTNGITFVAPTDGKGGINDCFASVVNGNPAITVDVTNKTIKVSFSPPLTNVACPLIVLPVSGVEGEIEPLSAGTWVFEILQNHYTVGVTEAPLLLSMQALTNSSGFQFDWPITGDTFALEFNDSLALGNWQAVTNVPTTSSNRNTVQIEGDSGSRFFRLRRL
jgi:hypothetical protein